MILYLQPTRIKIEKNKKNLNVNNKNKEVCKMESNQKIHCSVGSCKYNDITVQECKLKAINIMPNTNVNTTTNAAAIATIFNRR